MIKSKQKGVSLITLSIAIVLMIIITSILVYNAQSGSKIKSLNQMYNDVQLLSDKTLIYYSNYGAIPTLAKYENTLVIDKIKNNGQLSPNDNQNYYVIDLSAFKDLSLNYGRDFESVKINSSNANNKEDLYIINEQSHHIYYVKGIILDSVTYYTNDLDDEINLYY